MTVLEEILVHKRDELERARAVCPPDTLAKLARSLADTPRGLRAALAEGPAPRVIAEIKRRSPSRGEIRPDLDPVGCAKCYADSGAAAISVLTDERYFGGHLDHLEQVRRAVAVPVLRKDFLTDRYQVDEARVRGADAVLLIAAAFAPDARVERLRGLREHAAGLGLDALVEVHDAEELEAALAAGADLVGINNRDLRTFEVDLAVTERLAPSVPEGVVIVAESGIRTREDIDRLARSGADAFLVGESLMSEPDLGRALRRLRRTP